MNRIVLVSATWFEIEPTLYFLRQHQGLDPETFFYGKLEVVVCVTGAGMVNTALELGKLKGRDIAFAINAGLAGSFGKYKIGDVVNVTSDCYSELGAEDGHRFLSIDELGLGKQQVAVEQLFNNDYVAAIPVASGITVNTVHGNDDSISRIIQTYGPDVESMEGAAFIQAANHFKWQALQLRAISNKMERRNKDNWDIPVAVTALNDRLIGLLKHLNDGN